MKCIRMLYSDSKQGIDEEVTDFKQELKQHDFRFTRAHYIEHRNGHYTALVWYRRE